MTLPLPDHLLSISEVAALLGHSAGYVRGLVRCGRLHAMRPGSPAGGRGQWRVYPAAVRAYLGERSGRFAARLSKRGEAEQAAVRRLLGGHTDAPGRSGPT